MTENQKDYKTQIKELVANYEDGYGVIIKNKWDATLKLKPGAHGSDLPKNWLSMVERLTGIIAELKYGLDLYENEIHIVDVEQTLDAEVSNGLPYSEDYWQYGLEREIMDEERAIGEKGLPYELIINSDPTIGYFVQSNSKTTHVIAMGHATQGHSSFFKNNKLFKQFTHADEILGDLKRFASFVRECEIKYGLDRVEKILDACHALEMQAFNYRVTPESKSPEEMAMDRAAVERARDDSMDFILETTRIKRDDKPFGSVIDADRNRPLSEENLLRFIANAAPYLEPWERKIINEFCDRAQYFYPQMRTKLMNEGWASYWHKKIMNDLYEEGLINDGMMMEFKNVNAMVLFQPDLKQFNPYILGEAIFADIERMCKEPTEEDRKWFPGIAGRDWLEEVKKSGYNYHDEGFVYQFLSPKVMRDFHMFAFLNDDRKDKIEITAIADDDGYKEIRRTLAASFDIPSRIPQIEPYGYDERGDRTLMLKHTMHDRKPLDKGSAEEVLRHISQLWKYPVVLTSVDEDGATPQPVITCPPNVQYSPGSPIDRFLHPRLASSQPTP